MSDDIFKLAESSQRQTRVGFRDEVDRDYEERKQKMDQNIGIQLSNSNVLDHHISCVESPDKKKDRPPPSREYRATNDKEKDKLDNLKDQNLHLKTKKKELEEQVKQVATKLKRQINQLKKDRITGSGGKLYSKIDDELDALIDENVRLQDEESRLMEKVRALQAKRKMELGQGYNQVKVLTSTTTGFRKSSKSRSPTRQKIKPSEVELKSIRNNLEMENKKLETLKHDVEVLRRTTQGAFQSTYATEDLARELVQKQSKIRLERLKYEEIEETFKRKDHIYSSQKNAQDEFIKQLKELQSQYQDLLKKNRAYSEAAKETEYLQTKIAEVIIERDKLQKEFDTITKQPFFKREADQDHYKKITNIEQDLDKKEAEIRKSKANQLQLDEEIRKLQEEQRNLTSEKNTYQEEIERLRIQLDPNSLSFADIQRKVHSLDPVLFRQVMKDLKYDGDEPIWAKFDFMERLKIGPQNQPLDDKDPMQLANEINRLKLERRDLASELQKTQNLLKIQVDIDKENASLYQAKINELQSQINADNARIAEYTKIIQNRNLKLREIQNQAGKTKLTAAGLAWLDKQQESPERPQRRDEEVLSQFSVITTESEMAPQENAFELIISTAGFDKSKLSQILGNRELVPSAVQTFCTVDFYNHDTKSTDLAEGFDANYSTQFAFKNNIDDFYIQYLDKNYVVVDFFLSRAQSAPKIGTAKLPLCKLLEKDQSFQAQEIVHEGGQMGGSFPIGRVLYRMRMRKSIDEALRWYQQKQTLNKQRDPTSTLSKDANAYTTAQKRSKIIEIHVLRGHGFKRGDGTYTSKNIQPFFYFQFYTFEYTSPIVQGENPGFDIKKQFEVEENAQFLQYMRNQVLKIDFIDESVEMREGQNDYIGSARIPLRDVMLNEAVADSFPVKDEIGRENGRIDLRITCKDYSSYAQGVYADYEGSTMTIGKQFEEDIKRKIASKLSETPFQDMDMFFDLFNHTSKDYHKIHKKDFIQFILLELKIQGIREQDLEMFFKTSFVLQGKEFVDRNDFKSLFEYHIKEAQNKKQEILTDRQNKFNQANDFFRSGAQKSVNFQTHLNTSNVFLDQSLNNREDKTPSFVKKRDDFGGQPTQTQPPPPQKSQTMGAKKDKPLLEQIKDNVYHIINKFEEVAGAGSSFANFQQFQQAMEYFTSDENDIANLWGQYNIDAKFFYHQQLLRLSNAKIAEDPSIALLNQAKTSNDPRLNQIKNKIREHMFKNDYSLDDIFSYLDKDKSKGVSLQELTNGLKNFLAPEESKILFSAIDKDRSGEISYNEVITECSKINCAYVLFKIQELLNQNKSDPSYNPEKIFDQFDRNRTGSMEIQEFNDLLNFLYANVGKLEVDSLFKHFDVSGRGRLTKQEFASALTKPVALENKLEPSLHELLTPLQTKLKQMNLDRSHGIIFDRFHGGKQHLTMNDLKDIIYFFLKIQLSGEEEALIAKFIEEQFRKGPVLNRDNFIQVLGTKFVTKSFGQGNKTVAVETFKKLKNTLILKKKQMREMVEPFADEGVQRNINIRNMKIFLFNNFNISTYEIENLIDYLDQDNNGFIPSQDFIKEVELA